MIAFGAEILKKYGVEIAPKTNVVKEGDNSRELYIVHKGKLEVVKNINGQDQILSYVKEGEFFGELSLLNKEPRSATVRSVDQSVVLKVSPESFEVLISKIPNLALKIIHALAGRLQKTNEQVVSLQEQDEAMKLFKTIVSKVKTVGHKTVKGIRVPGTIEAFGEEIKTPPEAIEEVKKDLEKATNVVNFLDEEAFEIPKIALFNEFIEFIDLRKKVIKSAS